MKTIPYVFVCFMLLSLAGISNMSGLDIAVKNDSELANSLARLKAGMTVLIAPGEYKGGYHVSDKSGTERKPIVIKGADKENPPVFTGGKQAFHFADCSYLTLSTVTVKGFPVNGINIDDGGSFETPARFIRMEHVTILDTGPKGNHDGLKMSGVDDFMVKDCTFKGWGGSGIDMVGCHKGTVEGCRFEGKKGFSQSNAIQLKGGTSSVLVHFCFFKDTGHRGINLGGSTGLQFFRPKVGDHEAKDIIIAGNRFTGCLAPVAFVTADSGHVYHNTIYLPDKWVLRILQETHDPKFKPCHNGMFEKNLIVFDSKVRTFVNVGPGTAPETFVFRSNAWFNLDGRRKPNLPTPEKTGIYQVDPELKDPGTPEMKIQSRDPKLKNVGADAYKPDTKTGT